MIHADVFWILSLLGTASEHSDSFILQSLLEQVLTNSGPYFRGIRIFNRDQGNEIVPGCGEAVHGNMAHSFLDGGAIMK